MSKGVNFYCRTESPHHPASMTLGASCHGGAPKDSSKFKRKKTKEIRFAIHRNIYLANRISSGRRRLGHGTLLRDEARGGANGLLVSLRRRCREQSRRQRWHGEHGHGRRDGRKHRRSRWGG